MRAQWLREKELIEVAAARSRSSASKLEARAGPADRRLPRRRARIQYGDIPAAELEPWRRPKLERTSQKEQARSSRRRSTDEDIAAIVSKWTGIPVTKMLESERDKLLEMEEASVGA